LLLNIRSIKSNIEKLTDYLDTTTHKPHIIAITETWLKSCTSNLYGIEGYTRIDVNRSSAKKTRGGGVSNYIHNDIKVLDYQNITSENVESLSVSLEIADKMIDLITIYRPQPPAVRFNDMIRVLERLMLNSRGHTIIMGDFNVDIFEPKRKTDISNKKKYLDTISSYGYAQVVKDPTRITSVHSSLIDHVITNNIGFIEAIENIPISGLDHLAVGFVCDSLDCRENVTQSGDHPPITKTLINRFVQAMDSSDWSGAWDAGTDIDIFYTELVNRTSSIIEDVSDNYKARYRKMDPPWCDRILKKHIKLKNLYYGLMIRFPSNKNFKRKWISHRKWVFITKRKNKRNYIDNTLIRSSNKPRDTWKIIRKINGLNSIKTIPSGDQSKLAEDFANVQNSLTLPPNDYVNCYYRHPNLKGDIYVYPPNLVEIDSIIRSLKNNTSPGRDGIHPAFVRATTHYFRYLINDIVNLIIVGGKVPKQIKNVMIIPIYKSGNKDDLTNYRPITILDTFAKIIDKFLCNRITSFIRSNELLDCRQYGFTQGKNTSDAIEKIVDTILIKMDQKYSVCCICIDFSKAFDRVDHRVLIDKCHYFGISGKMSDILTDYLSDRSFIAKVGSGYSKSYSLFGGVPQGSSLGPILFNIYIDDLIRRVGNGRTVVAYADDITVIICNRNVAGLIHEIDQVFGIIDDWSSINCMSINYAKTKILPIGKCTIPPYNFNNNQIEIVDFIDILGVTVDSKLNFCEHISRLSNKISPILGVLNKNKKNLRIDMRIKIFKGLILPRLTYAMLAWYTDKKCNKMAINKLFRRSLRTLVTKWTSSKTILRKYKLWNFNQSYLFYINCKTRKLLDLKDNNNICALSSLRNTRGYKINFPMFKLSKYKTAPLYRKVKEFERLTPSLRSKSNTYNKFKCNLRSYIG